MNLNERLKQINNRSYEEEQECTCGKDVPFLLSLIEKYREALEQAQKSLVNEYGYTVYETNFDCINSALAYFPEDEK